MDGGYVVEVLEPASKHNGEFVRLAVARAGHSVQVDVARDWREHPPLPLDIGPVLHLDDAVGSKVTATIGRGLPRDYLDVAAAQRRYPRRLLLQLAFHRDPGLRVIDVALAMQQLDRLPDAPFADYGLTDVRVADIPRGFEHWPRDADQDGQGHQAHAQSRPGAP